MATYLERYGLIGNEAFSQRIQVAMMVSAFGIINEAPTVPQHAKRVQWTQRVMQDAVKTPKRLVALRVLMDPSIDGTSSDSVLQARVDLLVPDFISMEIDFGG